MALVLNPCIVEECDGISYHDKTRDYNAESMLSVPKPIFLSSKDVDRFWSKVNPNGPKPVGDVPGGPCWEWMAGRFNNGYGQFNLAGKPSKAHRVSYVINIGDIPDGLIMDHLCKNKGCCNPLHVEPVSYRENAIRCDSAIADNARKTHCKNGHELAGDNVFFYKPTPDRPLGRRYCRVCRRASEKRLSGTPVTIGRRARKNASRMAKYVYIRGPHKNPRNQKC